MPKSRWIGQLRRSRFAGERGIFPVDVRATENMLRIGKEGTQTIVSTRTGRNLKQLRQVWALADVIADNVEGIQDSDDAMFLLKVKARLGRWVTDPRTGETWFNPDSIAEDSMPQEEFAIFYERFIDIVCNEIVPGMDGEELKKHILEIVAGELGRRAARGGRGEADK